VAAEALLERSKEPLSVAGPVSASELVLVHVRSDEPVPEGEADDVGPSTLHTESEVA
jgi:hypothetical protein